jgi:hypothetical protein
LRPDISKDHLGVALRAGHTFMQAAQRVLGGVVIEFGDRPDRLPAAQRVAVLAWNAQASMRTSRVGRRLRLPARRLRAGEHRKCDDQMQQNCRSQGFAQPFLNRSSTLNETETFNKLSKVMRKNSNPMPSQLIQSGIVVEGYTSTCSAVDFVIRQLTKRLPKFV